MIDRHLLTVYGAEATLITIRGHNPQYQGKPDPFAFKQRLGLVKLALESLVRLHLAALDYPAAAAVDDEIAARTLLDEPMRRDAALAATTLHALLGERDAMNASYVRLLTLHPSASERHAAEVAIAATRRRAEASTVRPRAQRAGLPKVRPPYMTVLIDVQW